MPKLSIRKGDTVKGGPTGKWQGLVLGVAKHGLRLRWKTGKLAGREALVPRELLVLLKRS